jgi:hypothetical protein
MDSERSDYANRAPVAAPAEWGDEILFRGRCCACRRDVPLRNVMCMAFRGPASAAGKGWGCLVCGLAEDGAFAVICDRCLEAEAPILDVCAGDPADPGRTEAAALRGAPWVHEMREHGDDD